MDSSAQFTQHLNFISFARRLRFSRMCLAAMLGVFSSFDLVQAAEISTTSVNPAAPSATPILSSTPAKPTKEALMKPVNPPENKAVSKAIPTTGLTSVPSTEPQTLPFTIGDAVGRAMDQNQNVMNFRERVEESAENITYAKTLLFPTINGVITATRQKDAVNLERAQFGGSAYNFYTTQIQLTQPLFRSGLLSGGIGVAKKEKEIRKSDLETTERDLTLSVIEAFYTVIANQQLSDLIKQTLTVEQESLSTAQSYFRIGRGQLIDVLQIKTQIALLYPKLSSAENQMKNAGAQLTAFLHANQSTSLHLRGDLRTIDTQVIAKLVESKKELPEITRSKNVVAQFDDQRTVLMSPNYPQLNLVGAVGRSAYTQSDIFNDFSTAWSVGLQLTIPLFSGLSSIYQRHVLAAQAKELDYQQHNLIDTLSSNQVQAERNLDTAAAVLQSSQAAADYSAASLREAQKDFRLQTISYLQLLTSQQNYLDAESSFVQSKYSYIDSVAKYFVASGIPISGLVSVLNAQ